jgi:acetylglutamate kinase
MVAAALSAEQKVKILTEALPFIQGFHNKTFVIHYAGDVLADTAPQAEFGSDVALLQSIGIRPVVVHGGAPQITAMLDKMGIYSAFRRGIRVTDPAIMEVVEMVLSKLNRELVGAINRQGGRAIGLSGVDGRFIHARKMLLPPEGEDHAGVDLGQVGEIERIDPDLISLHQANGFIPVVMPIGVGADGEPYNINADVVAGELAAALAAEKLILLTRLPGLHDQNGKLINGLTVSEMEGLYDTGRLRHDIFAKIEAALAAVKGGVKAAHIIDGRVPNALLLEVLTSEGIGTLVRSDTGPHFFSDSLRYLKADISGNFDGPVMTFGKDK